MPLLLRFGAYALLAPIALPALFVGLACSGSSDATDPDPDPDPDPGAVTLRVETVVTGLDTPWDLVWGPDNVIWVSERGGRISRVTPAGQRTTAGQLTVTESGESGLMGIALHPELASQPWVYAAHSYSSGGGGIRNRLVRMRWNGASLGAPEVLLADIPGSGAPPARPLDRRPEPDRSRDALPGRLRPPARRARRA